MSDNGSAAPGRTQYHELTASEMRSGLRRGDFSSSELTAALLQRAEALNPRLNAVISLAAETAAQQAEAADRRLQQPDAPPLCGIPLLHKDIFCTRNLPTSCGSRMLNGWKPPYSATVVEKLQAQGAVTLGKSNMDEFAMGSSNETSWYGPVHNPWDSGKVPGGSSGGSACAVAARMAPLATATDTGGSIRQPAALCGITGIKPTYGRVSRWGMIAFSSSLDQGGAMANTAEDAALLLQAMSGFDERDSTSADQPVPDWHAQLQKPLRKLTIGIPQEYLAGLDGPVLQAFEQSVAQLQSLGLAVRSVRLPHADLGLACYYILAPAECSSNLARYDGVRYGYRCDQPQNLEDLYRRSRGEGFGNEVKRRILLGTFVLSSGYYDAYYRQALKCRRLVRDDFTQALETVDLLVSPTCPGPAFALGEKAQDPIAMYQEDQLTLGVNLAGLPALSIPCGQADGLPLGLQLIGRAMDEGTLLSVAHHFQAATEFHRLSPAL